MKNKSANSNTTKNQKTFKIVEIRHHEKYLVGLYKDKDKCCPNWSPSGMHCRNAKVELTSFHDKIEIRLVSIIR